MKISVVIPVLNEESTILSALEMLESLEGEKEIVFVDGGSSDRTVALIGNRALLLHSPKGRARQMNKGAEAATGEVILFLHCDSKIGPHALMSIATSFDDSKVVGGGLTLQIDDHGLIYKIIAFGSNLRPRMSGIFFGDQGIFVKRQVFEQLGGFADLELMEDWDLSRRLSKCGKLTQVAEKITTSSRRWKKHGIWKTIWLMHKIKFLFLQGVNPEELNRIYQDVR